MLLLNLHFLWSSFVNNITMHVIILLLIYIVLPYSVFTYKSGCKQFNNELYVLISRFVRAGNDAWGCLLRDARRHLTLQCTLRLDISSVPWPTNDGGSPAHWRRMPSLHVIRLIDCQTLVCREIGVIHLVDVSS